MLNVLLVFVITGVSANVDFQDLSIEENIHRYLYSLEKIYDGPYGSILYGEDTLILNCTGHHFINIAFPPFEKTMTINQVTVEECLLPPHPLVEVLQKLNINISAVENLRISIKIRFPLKTSNYTAGLNIKTLWIHALAPRNWNSKREDIGVFLKYNPHFMTPLTNLTTLIFEGPTLPPLPSEMHLRVLSLKNFVIVPTWERYCTFLRELSIHNLAIADVPSEWPKNCSQLSALRLSGMRDTFALPIIRTGINASCTRLNSLYVESCNLTVLPFEIINVAANSLKNLSLHRNLLTDKNFEEFPSMPNLLNLDLSENSLVGWILFDLVQQVPALRYLNLDGNNFVNFFCTFDSRINTFTSLTTSLEILSMRKMPIDVHCLQNAHFSNLEYLNMAFAGPINSLELQKLPKTNASQLKIDLRGRPLKWFSFHEFDYENLLENPLQFWRSHDFINHTRLTVLLTYINCDCQHYWLARGLRDLPNFVDMPELRCEHTGIEIIKESEDTLDCFKDKQFGCTVRSSGSIGSQRKHKKIETVECHNSDEENLKYPINVRRGYKTISLNASDNHIQTLQRITFPDAMQWIDLRKNRISRLDINDTTRLFANRERKVWLSENLFVCDCENAPMMEAFHEHRDQIMDFNDLVCIDSGKLLRSVTTYEVCQIALRTSVAISGTLTALITIAGVILWRYRLQVKIYLYSRGWCLFCLTEEDDDADRPYDAFLSFSHGDEAYVTEQLLPKLEGDPNFYRMCVHYRDWAIGGWIPAHIMRSVRLSKRTIIVLSRNFAQSKWGALEFRYAAASASQESRSRLLVLVLDDVLSENLDGELRGYLSYNTYLRCDDPWFWEKLRYSMPRSKRFPTEDQPAFPTAQTNSRIVRDLSQILSMEPLTMSSPIIQSF